MKYCRLALGLVLLQLGPSLLIAGPREQSFDAGWRFLRADATGAENPAFDDSSWRTLAVPNEPASFRAPERKTFQSRCLAMAILRPTGEAGKIILRAEADGLEPAVITVRSR